MTAAGLASLNRQRLVQYFFFGVFAVIVYQLLKLLSPFYIAVLGSAIVALIVHPLHRRVRQRLGAPNAAAAASAALAVLLLVLPTLLFAWAFLRDAARLYPAALDWLESLRSMSSSAARDGSGAAQRLLEAAHLDLEDILLKNLAELRGEVSGLAAAAVRNTVFVAFNVALLAFTLFFFLRDGETILARLVELVPMAAEHKAAILARLKETLLGLVRGVLALAVIQGVLNGLGFALIGVPLPALLGMLTTLLSPIPFLAPLGVLVPVAIGVSTAGSTGAGVLAALWAVAVAALIERGLRPVVIRPQNEIPVPLLFFGLLGGLRVYGPIGILLGPVLIALTLAFVNVYREDYRWLLEEAKP